MEYSLDPKAELLIWGPTPSYPLVRIDTCGRALFQVYPKLYPGHSWPKTTILTGGDRFAWICEQKEIEANGQKLLIEQMLPKDIREQVREKWRKALHRLRDSEQKIAATDLTKISNDELLGLWNTFHDLTDAFWAHASLPELSNYGSAEYLKGKLAAVVPAEEIGSVMEVLAAPIGLSFYQEEEIDLAETDDLAEHQRKFFWLRNSYGNVEVLPISFFEERKKVVPKNIREDCLSRLTEVRDRKSDVQKKYALSQEVMDIADAIADGIVWQDTRKGDIWQYLHYENLLLNEIARRFKASKDLIGHLMVDEISQFMEGKLAIEEYQWRCDGVAYVVDDEGAIRIEGNDTAKEYWKAYVDHPEEAAVSEFKGIVASKGKGIVRGKVRIVLDAYNAGEFEDQEILVTTMTTPEFVFLMKKAGAIVTDTGGLTSHAAIVSRELGVPCIVATKVATRMLRDGDLIEVDAEKGTVRKL